MMKFTVAWGGLAIVIALAAPTSAQTPTPTPVDCDAVRCQVQSALDANCSCDGSSNHGRYVSCVVRTLKGMDIPRQCRGKVVRCAAISTCSKPGFQTCVRPRFGSCDLTTGACVRGTLRDGLTSCTAHTDCLAGTFCTIMRAFSPRETPTPGGDRCTVLGGVPGMGSCCGNCP
jgi:hypothetical protein